MCVYLQLTHKVFEVEENLREKTGSFIVNITCNIQRYDCVFSLHCSYRIF